MGRKSDVGCSEELASKKGSRRMAPKRARPKAATVPAPTADNARHTPVACHSEGDYPLEVREDIGMGRYFVAAKPLSAGQLVLQAAPTAAALSDAFLDSHCSGCFRPTQAEACACCRKMRFCDTCTRSGVQHHGVPHVQLHAIECEGISSLFSDTKESSQKYYRFFNFGDGDGGWKVYESRTVRLFMRLLVLRAVEMGKLELTAEDRVDGGPGGGGRSVGKKRKVGRGGKGSEKREAEEGRGEAEEDEEEDPNSQIYVELPSYQEAFDALCKSPLSPALCMTVLGYPTCRSSTTSTVLMTVL